MGVDTDNDQTMDQWTEWAKAKEAYDYIEGFSKQVAKTPAQVDLSSVSAGFEFQFEVKLKDTTENQSRPILEKVELMFGE